MYIPWYSVFVVSNAMFFFGSRLGMAAWPTLAPAHGMIACGASPCFGNGMPPVDVAQNGKCHTMWCPLVISWF